ncbi:MAG: hypothetical protein WEE89_23080 [Gemmatimonadota bacterium]
MFRSAFPKLAARLFALGLVGSTLACAGALPRPGQIVAPPARTDNSGKFLSPYTSDGTVAPWVVKGRSAKLGAAVGSFAGRKGGEAALNTVPLVGGWLGGKAGDRAGREIALRWVGGENAMRETSDLSFDQVDDMIVYLYSKHYVEKDKEWEEVFDLTKQIYPDLEKRWTKAIKKAKRA